MGFNHGAGFMVFEPELDRHNYLVRESTRDECEAYISSPDNPSEVIFGNVDSEKSPIAPLAHTPARPRGPVPNPTEINSWTDAGQWVMKHYEGWEREEISSLVHSMKRMCGDLPQARKNRVRILNLVLGKKDSQYGEYWRCRIAAAGLGAENVTGIGGDAEGENFTMHAGGFDEPDVLANIPAGSADVIVYDRLWAEGPMNEAVSSRVEQILKPGGNCWQSGLGGIKTIITAD